MSASVSPSRMPCPRCGVPAARLSEGSGTCVRCTSERILALTVNEPTAHPPLAAGSAPGEFSTIGPYAIIDELGHGGMGVVYLAQHVQLGQIVALKTIRSARAGSPDFELRFLREAQTMARLRHPHIVAVHDAGRAEGHAYFAMDYAEGGDLARRLREQRQFAPPAAARLLHQVATAVAHSHAEGVLHRDLKPSNILLEGDNARVADFGLAAELEAAGDLTAHTALLGTPHYLSPEALRGRRADRGVASDIYALGVILYELLAGRTPFAGASAAELPALAATAEPPPLRLLAPQVARDLEVICAKCLECEPARRYRTAAALAEDLRRFLAGEPILARPVSAAGQLLRWARRRPALAAIWLLSLLLAAGSLTSAVLINRERVRADAEALTNATLAEFLAKEVLGQAAPSDYPDRDIKLRTALDHAAAKISDKTYPSPTIEANIRFFVGSTYSSLGDFAEAERMFRRAAALRRRHLGPHHPDTLQATSELASTLNHLGRSPEAAPLIRTTLAAFLQTVGPDHPGTIRAMAAESMIERKLGQTAKAEALIRKTLAIARRALGSEHELTRDALVNLATILEAQGKIAEATTASRESVATTEKVLGPRHIFTLGARVDLAALEGASGQAAAAETTLRGLHATLSQQAGPEHPESLRTLSNLGSVLTKLEKHAEAEALYAELLAVRQRVAGAEHPATLQAMKALVLAHARNGHLAEAIVLMRELTELSERALTARHPTTLNHLRNLAGMLLSAERYEEALKPAHTAYTISLAEFGAEDIATLADAETLANTLSYLDRFPEAEPIWRQSIETRARIEPDLWRGYFTQARFGRLLARAGRHAEAEPYLRDGYEGLWTRQASLTPSRRRLLPEFADDLANVYLALGRPSDAAVWQAKRATPPTTPSPPTSASRP